MDELKALFERGGGGRGDGALCQWNFTVHSGPGITLTKESKIAEHGPEVDAASYKSDYSVVGKQTPRY
jgi:hypothetical protein